MAAAAPAIQAVVPVVTAVAGVVGSVFNTVSQKKTADKNLSLQQEQFEYEKDLQNQIMDREDNAIQRQVADSRSAGISPILNMAGAQSSGAAGVAVNAPQKEQAPDITGSLFTAISGLSSVMQTINETKKSQAEIDSLKMQNEFDALTMASRVQNMNFLPMLAQSRLQSDALSRRSVRYQLDNVLPLTRNMQQAQYDDFMREYKYRQDNNIFKSTPTNPFTLGGAIFENLRNFKLPSSAPNPEVDAIREKGNEAQSKALDASNDIVDEIVKMIDEATSISDKKKKRAKNLYQNSARLRNDAARAGQL